MNFQIKIANYGGKVRCTNCESLIDDDARFCSNCGSQIFKPVEEKIDSPKSQSDTLISNDFDDKGTRGTKQKLRTKFFYGKARYAHEVDKVVNRFLLAQNLETQIIEGENEIIVQGKKKSNIFNKALGLEQAVTVGISIEGNDIRLTVGGAKWADKAVGATIGLVIFAPVILTAGWGAYKQVQLFSKIEEEVDSFLSSRE